MSLINDMLNDLEKRGVKTKEIAAKEASSKEIVSKENAQEKNDYLFNRKFKRLVSTE